MFTLYEQNEAFTRLNQHSKKVLADLLDSIKVERRRVEFKEHHSFFAKAEERNSLFLIQKGFVRCEMDGKVLFILECGDICSSRNLISDQFRLIADSALVVEEFRLDSLMEELSFSPVTQRLWNEYQETQFDLHISLISLLMDDERTATKKERKTFKAGEPIIIEGTMAQDVLIMLHGEAEVFVGDTKVGQILSGEIFGAIAPLFNITRSASVVAKTPCIVSRVAKNNFLELVKTHPNTVMKLIEDMARIIMSQNEKIVSMTQ